MTAPSKTIQARLNREPRVAVNRLLRRGCSAFRPCLDLEDHIWKDDEQEHSEVEPGNSILLRPVIALVAPRDRLATDHMPLDRFRLSNIACVFQESCVNHPAGHTRLRRRTKADCRICRPVITVI